MLTKRSVIAAGFALLLVTPAYADTPIGPGVTGSGGTGANKSDDPSTGAGPGTEIRGAAREGTAKGASSSSESKAGARSGATGATSGAAMGGSAGAGVEGNSKGGANAKGSAASGAGY